MAEFMIMEHTEGTPRWAPYASWGASAAAWQALFGKADAEEEDVHLWGFGEDPVSDIFRTDSWRL